MKRLFKSLSVLLAAVALSACSFIDTGNVGVTKTAGQYNQEELSPGGHWTWFATVYEVSVKENLITLPDMKPKSKNQITLEDLDLDIYFQIDATKASEIMSKLAGDLSVNSDKDYVPGMNYITRAAREAAYNEAAKINADEMQAKRNDIPNGVAKSLQAELDTKLGPKWVTITNVNLRNLTVSSALEKAIAESARVAYETEARLKQVALAEAEADRQRAQAKGEADAARIKAEGLKGSSGTEYLRLLELQNQARAIEKWDGKLPATVAGGATPFIDLKK